MIWVMAANHQLSTPTPQNVEVARPTELTVDAIRFYEKRRVRAIDAALGAVQNNLCVRTPVLQSCAILGPPSGGYP